MTTTTGIDKLGKMREIVQEELKHIPGDNPAQKRLRQIYWMLRMNSLGEKISGQSIKRRYIARVRQNHQTESSRFQAALRQNRV